MSGGKSSEEATENESSSVVRGVVGMRTMVVIGANQVRGARKCARVYEKGDMRRKRVDNGRCVGFALLQVVWHHIGPILSSSLLSPSSHLAISHQIILQVSSWTQTFPAPFPVITADR